MPNGINVRKPASRVAPTFGNVSATISCKNSNLHCRASQSALLTKILFGVTKSRRKKHAGYVGCV
jgi:hypothetical protein